MAKAAAKKATPAPKKTPKKAATEAPKKAVAKKAAGKKAAAGKTNAGLMAPLTVSPVLAEVIGGEPTPRTQIIKKIWDYIKKNDLQNKENRRMIDGDEKLKAVFGKDQVSMFELAKIVNNHVQKAE
jgi:chromatin remodeling complex protein RSC6